MQNKIMAFRKINCYLFFETLCIFEKAMHVILKQLLLDIIRSLEKFTRKQTPVTVPFF